MRLKKLSALWIRTRNGMNLLIIASITWTRMTPFHGRLTPKFPCANRSRLRIERVSYNTTASDSGGGRSRRGTETGANGANRRRWFVVTSIWKLKYLTEQISERPGDNFLCAEMFTAAERQPVPEPILKRACQILSLKDTSYHYTYTGR